LKELADGIVINENEYHPLSKYVIDYLMSQKRESSFLDLKKIISIAKDDNDFPKLIKDAIAFSNNGGGFILVGIMENDRNDKSIKGRYIPSGLPEDFTIDQASLQEKINSYLNTPLEIEYLEFEYQVEIKKGNREKKVFAAIYFPPGHDLIVPIKDGDYRVGEKVKKAFKKGDIIVRRGTQSVLASRYEIEWIKRRAKERDYQLSILNGKADEVDETLYSNLFEIKKLPRYIWLGPSKYDDFAKMREILDEKKPDVLHGVFRCRYWNRNIVSFTNLSDIANEYHYLVREEVNPNKELVSNWLQDKDKRYVINELLINELFSFAVNSKGMYLDWRRKKLYFPAHSFESRSESWPTRYSGVSTRIVANKMYSPKLRDQVYWHVAIMPEVKTIGERQYLSIFPTIVITKDGRKPLEGEEQGAVITSLQYNKYNDQYLNTLLFWAKKLSDGTDDITLPHGFTVSANPVSTTIGKGVRWDLPASEIKDLIETYESNHPLDESEIEIVDDEEETGGFEF